MGSFASNIILASASMRARWLDESSTKIEKVTKPCPLVILFGGRNPILGSRGSWPKNIKIKHVNYTYYIYLLYIGYFPGVL